jgi:hypothetical protein
MRKSVTNHYAGEIALAQIIQSIEHFTCEAPRRRRRCGTARLTGARPLKPP